MNTIDTHNGYTLTRTDKGEWSIHTDGFCPITLSIHLTFDWDNNTRHHEVKLSTIGTGIVTAAEAANIGEEIIRAAKTAEYFTGIIALYEGTLQNA